MPIPEDPVDGSRGVAIAVVLIAVLIAGLVGAWLTFGSGNMAAESLAPVSSASSAGGGNATPSVADRSNTAPTAVIRLMRDPKRRHVYQYSGIFSEDPDPADQDRLTYRWNFGDGTSDTRSIGTHTFAQGGELTVTLTVTDTAGASDTTSQTIVVDGIHRLEPDRASDASDRPGLRCQRVVSEIRSFADLEAALPSDDLIEVEAVGVNREIRPRDEWFALSFSGGLRIEQPGIYEFHLISDDGGRLVLGGEELIRMDRMQRATREMVVAVLEPGIYDLRIDYFQGVSNRRLDFEWRPPGADKTVDVPPSALVHRTSD